MAVILPLVEAAAHLPARGALIGLDLGTKTIGIAVCDPDRRLATGVETIARKNFTADAARVLALAAERSAVGFVLGLPINMNDTEGPLAPSFRVWAPADFSFMFAMWSVMMIGMMAPSVAPMVLLYAAAGRKAADGGVPVASTIWFIPTAEKSCAKISASNHIVEWSAIRKSFIAA